ncbi:related to syntaxin 18 [Lecanosticta acicola]|uniref:Related to syntaxin 18 n=1 Tax=Lecanosticta acicola TaxID=111012 RepID=A0AAI8YZN0_9PEZI|nr:related to syntaxin 18 [Lecanosticta acicola]
MTEITPDFSVCLQKQGATPVLKREYNLEAINSFLQEAYRINARIADLNRYLRSIRPVYLSAEQPSRRRQGAHSNDRARPLTDNERDKIDAESKQLLRQLNATIENLKQAEQVRNQTADSVALSKRAKGGLGAIGRWAAGGAVTAKSPEEEQEEAARKTIAAVRESMILFLSERLEEAGRVQSEMMDVRLRREVEKSKSILAKSPVAGGVPQAWAEDESSTSWPASSKKLNRYSGGWDSNDMEDQDQPQLSEEQLQQFAEENHELLKHYEDQLDQVRTAERSILEISELHSTLHANLTQQAEHIEQLVQDSYLTTENVGKGNKELKRASERQSTAQLVFYSTAAFCSFLVIWDLVF